MNLNYAFDDPKIQQTTTYRYMRNNVRNDSKLHFHRITTDLQWYTMNLNCTILSHRRRPVRNDEKLVPFALTRYNLLRAMMNKRSTVTFNYITVV